MMQWKFIEVGERVGRKGTGQPDSNGKMEFFF